MNPKEKRQTIARSILSILSKGRICNESAKKFIEDASSELTNMEIIKKISENISELTPLSSEEISVLTDILDRHNLLNSPLQSQICTDSINHSSLVLLDGNLKITDLSPVKQSYEDEYDFILDHSLAKRIYLIESQEQKADFNVKFTNYIFGNLCIDTNSNNYNEKLLISLLSRKNVVNSLLDNFGFISENSSEKCPIKYQKEMLFKLFKSYPTVELKRLDGSYACVLKIGTVSISKFNKISERLDQYLISSNSRLYLTYGKINFDLIKISPQYKYNVANFLLGYSNLNASRYIGSLIDNKICKSDVPFEKAATSGMKSKSNKVI